MWRSSLTFKPNKNRLYISVYPSDEAPEDTQSFNWGFLVGPKNEDKAVNPGRRHRIQRLRPGHPQHDAGKVWGYFETDLPSVSSVAHMYARIRVAKIEDDEVLLALIREMRPPGADPGDAASMAFAEGYTSRDWVAAVLARMEATPPAERPVGRAVLNWEEIERTARRYVAGKIATDRYKKVEALYLPKPTWDMLLDKETSP